MLIVGEDCAVDPGSNQALKWVETIIDTTPHNTHITQPLLSNIQTMQIIFVLYELTFMATSH